MGYVQKAALLAMNPWVMRQHKGAACTSPRRPYPSYSTQQDTSLICLEMQLVGAALDKQGTAAAGAPVSCWL